MRFWMLIICCLAFSAQANLGWDLEQQKQKYGVPSVDKQKRPGYPGLLFRHYFLHGTHIDVGIQNFNGKWRSVWESYQNFREVRDGYRDGRPVFKQEMLPFSEKDLKRRLSANGGKTGWDSKAQAAVAADGTAFVIMKRNDGVGYAVFNDNIIYVTTKQHYPGLRKALKLPPVTAEKK